ncbi:type II secretion system F family protein [Cryptosporangium arvum]|uniref:Flp pilus assembly protein TadB n=1 Tax=Cryptosporangium arvum DSM 44712 TaxID=927661 RepID=A0A010ZMX4_9ACTN|nr:type II secretion system F family protein [Cryptosporangium arvum]EXG80039.1 Flp pilus assembly protein TadB [Cryptosporangium arvum DSM 44712]
MSTVGALFGLALAFGLVLVLRGGPPARHPRLDDRLAPYVGRPDVSRAALRGGGRPGPRPREWVVAGRAVGDVVAGWIDRLLPGGAGIRRRLSAAGRPGSVPAFRAEQVRWAAAGLLAGAVSGGALGGGTGLVLLTPIGALAGGLGRDWWLSVQVRRRTEALRAELPVIAELLALAVTAGEAPVAALRRVSVACRGELGRELTRVVDESRSGAGLTTALEELAARTALEPLVRFVDGFVIALDRGTPLAEVLRAQASDVREAGHRALLEAGGRREIAMMVPVVFLILPVTVLFALYPGLVSISLLTR